MEINVICGWYRYCVVFAELNLIYEPTSFLFCRNLQWGLFAPNFHRSELKLQALSLHLAAEITPSMFVAICEGSPGAMEPPCSAQEFKCILMISWTQVLFLLSLRTPKLPSQIFIACLTLSKELSPYLSSFLLDLWNIPSRPVWTLEFCSIVSKFYPILLLNKT